GEDLRVRDGGRRPVDGDQGDHAPSQIGERDDRPDADLGRTREPVARARRDDEAGDAQHLEQNPQDRDDPLGLEAVLGEELLLLVAQVADLGEGDLPFHFTAADTALNAGPPALPSASKSAVSTVVITAPASRQSSTPTPWSTASREI